MSQPRRSDWPWGNVLNFDDEQTPETDSSIPDVTIRDEENSYELEIEAADLDKKDFEIFVENSLLTVSANKQADPQNGRSTFFSSTFNVPMNADRSKIQANYTNGVLKISLPKTNGADSRSKKFIEVS